MYSTIDRYRLREDNIAKYYEHHLPTIIHASGTYVNHYRQIQTIQSVVYDIMPSGSTEYVLLNPHVKALIPQMGWRTESFDNYSFYDESTDMFCQFDIRSGDLIELDRDTIDGHKYKVTFTEIIGNTRSLLRRFKMVNVSE